MTNTSYVLHVTQACHFCHVLTEKFYDRDTVIISRKLWFSCTETCFHTFICPREMSGDSDLIFTPLYKEEKSSIWLRDQNLEKVKKSETNMNFKMIFTIIFLIVITSSSAARLGGKGNMRGMLTRASGLSSRQMILLRKQLYFAQKRKYGRFAWIAETKLRTHPLMARFEKPDDLKLSKMKSFSLF